MSIGDRNHKVEIQEPIINEAGEVTDVWIAVAKWWCDIQPIRGRERMQADQVVADVSHILEGCWIEGVTPDMRVKYGKRVFYFDSVINVKELNRDMEISAREEIPAPEDQEE